MLAVFTQLAIMESIFVLHRISQPSLRRRFIFGCEFKRIIFISTASRLGLAFFSRDQRQLGKDLLIVYAKCLFLVGVLYFISLFRILTARENPFILILFSTMRRPFNLGYTGSSFAQHRNWSGIVELAQPFFCGRGGGWVKIVT